MELDADREQGRGVERDTKGVQKRANSAGENVMWLAVRCYVPERKFHVWVTKTAQ